MARDSGSDGYGGRRSGSDAVLMLLAVGLLVLLGLAGAVGVFMWRKTQEAQVMAREMAVEAARQRATAVDAAREAMEKSMAEAAAAQPTETAPEASPPPGPNIAKFMNELINSGGAQVVGDPATLEQLLAESAKRLDEGGMRSSPLSEASARSSIGLTYLGLQRYDEAELHLRLACDLRRRILGNEHPDVARDDANLKRCLDLRPPR